MEGQFFPGQRIQFDCPPAIRHPFKRMTLIEILTRQGLTGNLKLCLDAADSVSLPASSTKWLDRSGGGYDFFRGTTAGAEATDPTINGSAGGRSSNEYLSFDGGDYLLYDTTSEAWMSNIHKSTCKFTAIMWIYVTGTAIQRLLGNRSATTHVGFSVAINIDPEFAVSNGSANVINQGSGLTVPLNTWFQLAVSYDAVTPTLFMRLNNTNAGLSTTPGAAHSAANATNNFQIGAVVGATDPIDAGGRMAMLAMWEGVALTTTQISAVYHATRNRFGV